MQNSQELVEKAERHEWNLQCDESLLEIMKNVASKIEQRSETTQEALKSLSLSLDECLVSMGNLTRINSIKQNNYCESLISEDQDIADQSDVAGTVKGSEPVKLSPQIAIENGLKLLDNCFEKHRVTLDHDNPQTSLVYRPIDRYMCILPHVIGSDKWKSEWHVGCLPEKVTKEQIPEPAEVNQPKPVETHLIPGQHTEISRQPSLESLAKSTSSIGDQMIINSKSVGIFDEFEDPTPAHPSVPPISTSIFRPQPEQRKIVNLFDDEPPSLPPSPAGERKPANLFDDYGSEESLPVTPAASRKPQNMQPPVDLFNDNDFDDFIKKIEKNEDEPEREVLPVAVKPAAMPDMRKIADEIKNIHLKKSGGVPTPQVKQEEKINPVPKAATRTSVPKPDPPVTKIQEKVQSPRKIQQPEVEKKVATPQKTPTPAKTRPTKIANLFDDDEPDDFFSEIIKQKTASKTQSRAEPSVEKKSTAKSNFANLFDDDDDERDESDSFNNIFSKKSSERRSAFFSPEKSKSHSLFDDGSDDEKVAAAPRNQGILKKEAKKSLFDDEEDVIVIKGSQREESAKGGDLFRKNSPSVAREVQSGKTVIGESSKKNLSDSVKKTKSVVWEDQEKLVKPEDRRKSPPIIEKSVETEVEKEKSSVITPEVIQKPKIHELFAKTEEKNISSEEKDFYEEKIVDDCEVAPAVVKNSEKLENSEEFRDKFDDPPPIPSPQESPTMGARKSKQKVGASDIEQSSPDKKGNKSSKNLDNTSPEKKFNAPLPFVNDIPPDDDDIPHIDDNYEDDAGFAAKPTFSPFSANTSNYSAIFDEVPPDDDFIPTKPPVPEPNFLSDDDQLETKVKSTDELDRSRNPSSVKNKLNIFAKKSEDKTKPGSVKKPTPGKLNANLLKINVNALLPGARAPVKTVTDTEGDSKPNSAPSSEEKPKTSTTPGLLNNDAAKSRAKIQVKRRPSTRQGRKNQLQSALEKSLEDSLDIPEEESVKSEENSKKNVLPVKPEAVKNVKHDHKPETIDKTDETKNSKVELQEPEMPPPDYGEMKTPEVVSQKSEIPEAGDGEFFEETMKDSSPPPTTEEEEEFEVELRRKSQNLHNKIEIDEEIFAPSPPPIESEDSSPPPITTTEEDLYVELRKKLKSETDRRNFPKNFTQSLPPNKSYYPSRTPTTSTEVEIRRKSPDLLPKIEINQRNFPKNLAQSIFADSDDEEEPKQIITQDHLSSSESQEEKLKVDESRVEVTTNKISVFYDDEEDTRLMLEEHQREKRASEATKITNLAQSIFDDGSDYEEEVVNPPPEPKPETPQPKPTSSLFEDEPEDDDEDLFRKKPQLAIPKKSSKLFESDDEDDPNVFSRQSASRLSQPKRQSLFGDDESDDDLFGSKSKAAPSTRSSSSVSSTRSSIIKKSSSTVVDDPLKDLM